MIKMKKKLKKTLAALILSISILPMLPEGLPPVPTTIVEEEPDSQIQPLNDNVDLEIKNN